MLLWVRRESYSTVSAAKAEARVNRRQALAAGSNSCGPLQGSDKSLSEFFIKRRLIISESK